VARSKLSLIQGGGDTKMLERIGHDLAERSNLEWFAEFVSATEARIRQAEDVAAAAHKDGAKDLSLRAIKTAHSMHADLVRIGSSIGVIASGGHGPRVVNFNTVNVTGGGGPEGGGPVGDLAAQVQRNLIELQSMMEAGGVSILDIEPQERVATQIAPRQATERAGKILRGGTLRRRRVVDIKPEEKI